MWVDLLHRRWSSPCCTRFRGSCRSATRFLLVCLRTVIFFRVFATQKSFTSMTVLHRLTLVEVLVRHLCAASLERHVRPISCWKSSLKTNDGCLHCIHTFADEAAPVPRSTSLKLSTHCIAAAGLVLHAVALVALQEPAGSDYLGNLSTWFTSSELVSPAVSQSLLQPFPWQLQNVKT